MEDSAPAGSSVPLVVDVFSDVVCPWCFVGNERLERVLATLPPDTPPVTVKHHPFLLDPSTPPEGRNVPAMLRERYGLSDPRQAWARVEAEARKAGVELDLSKQPTMFPTLRAQTLIRRADAKGTARALVRELFRGYFLEALNIADVEVLAGIASRHGFSADETAALLRDDEELAVTRRDARAAAAAGITGVPFYVLDERLAISGAQPEEVFRAAIARAVEEARGGQAIA